MNRRAVMILAFLLILFIGSANLAPYDRTPTIVERPQEQSKILATDGDVSDGSILQFKETLQDDILFYTDLFHNDTIDNADTGSASGDDTTGSYTDTFSINGVSYGAQSDPSNAYVYLNFTVLSEYIEGVRLAIYGNATVGVYTKNVEIYDFTAETWTDYDDLETSNAWYNYTTYDPDYWDVDDVVYARIHLLTTVGVKWGYVDYAEVTWYYMTLADSDHYAESFADVSEWVENSFEAGDSTSTDGDVLSIEVAGDSTDDLDRFYTNDPSFTAEGYIEIRWRVNQTSSVDYIYLVVYTADTMGGSSTIIWDAPPPTDWRTKKLYISQTVESIELRIRSDSGAKTKFDVDYLRIGPADETGFQHDGSTTVGITNDGDGDKTYSVSSDGDILTFNVTTDVGASGSVYYYLTLDTTATVSDFERDYYPFFMVRARLIGNTGGGAGLYITSDGYRTTIDSNFAETDWTTFRVNHKVSSTSDANKRFYLYWGGGDDKTIEFELDFVKAYSIANFTISQHASAIKSDFLYIDDSDDLIVDTSSSHYFILNRDPALSVAVATYTIWNITESNGWGAADYVQFYVGASWETYYGTDTRGSFTGTGTLTDIAITIFADATISAIKFIEDATAPVISDFWTVPYTPTEDDDLTLAIYETDVGAGTYTVTFNAVDYPAGFSDTDYSATESSTKSGLWSYTFSAADVPAGYYAFEVTASDGANSGTDLEILRVTTIYLQITDIVLITATEELAQISGHSNKDCSYQIYENNSLQGSGSVSSGWFSVSWTKDSTAGAYIELGIKFYVDVYSDWINGSYSVASAEVLYVTDTVYSASDSFNYLSGHLNLDGVTWTAFDNDSQKDTGSLNTGSFSIHWVKVFARGLHEWGVSFTDGVTTRWVNGSYEAEGLVITDLIVMQNNESIIVGGFFYTSNLTLTWESYEAGVFVDSGTLELASSGEYNSIYWEKNTPLLFKNFTLSITSDGSTINLHSYSLVLDTATYLTTVSGSSLVIYEGDSYFDESTSYEGVEASDMAMVVMGLIVFVFLVVIVVAVVTWRDGRNKAEQLYQAQIASGGYR